MSRTLTGNLLEADLEEIYFYKIDHPGGYAYQRVYNDDRSIDGVMMAQNHDSVLVPEGYHPVVSAHGYTTYYLNFLAGSAQSLANSDDPAYSHGCRGPGLSRIRACRLCIRAWRGKPPPQTPSLQLYGGCIALKMEGLDVKMRIGLKSIG